MDFDCEYQIQRSSLELEKDHKANSECSEFHYRHSNPKPQNHNFIIFALGLVIINVLALALFASQMDKPQCSQPQTLTEDDNIKLPKNRVYSPAEEYIEYQTVTFHSGLGVSREYYPTPYQGPPSDAVDQAWESLYNNYGVNQIDKETADKLASPTLAVPGDENHYFTGLDVFHQLHCLNHLRKSLWPDYYHLTDNLTDAEVAMEVLHTDHCINSIRQSLMCTVDITPLSWRYNPETKDLYPSASTVHTCRNFKRIQEWSMENRFAGSTESIMIQDGEGAEDFAVEVEEEEEKMGGV